MALRFHSLVALFQCPIDLPFGVALGDGLPFVVELFAPGQRDLDLCATVLQVQPCGDDGEALLLDAAPQSLDLAPVKEQSDAAGTALHCHSLALLSDLCGFREELGWTPLTEWRMRLGRMGSVTGE